MGHLLSRVTADLFDISELLHHGPEDVVISLIKLVGSVVILSSVNPTLAMVALSLVVVMFVFAIVMNRKMKKAYAANRARIADINSQIEDSLSGIRVVKSFSNEEQEMAKFRDGNERFVASKRKAYYYMGGYNSGMGIFTSLITVGSLIVGAFLMAEGKMSSTDLVTFLLYISLFSLQLLLLLSLHI